MVFYDPFIHPALIDPRQWADVNLYELVPPVEREPLHGKPHAAPDRKFEVRHLRLDLQFDDQQESVSGTARLTLKPLNDGLDHVTLDAAEMSISWVRVDGNPVEFTTELEELTVELAGPASRREEMTLEIAYSCRPRKGLFFVKPDEAYPSKPAQIWSQGENEDAHWWFPCADVTNQKMTTELIATVREDFIALSNGVLVSTSSNPAARTRTWHWRQEQPHPAYLVTFVAGHYEQIEERHGTLLVDYYVYRDRREAGEKLFANTTRMIAFFESKFGVAYPYAKYSQILVDDFLFGAMENTSATTMTDRVLLDERAAIDLDYDDIVAHELAHQWWGDLVTCKEWSEIWLNESFATYSEYLWREFTKGTDEARFALFQDTLVYLREDRTSHRRPIACNRYRYSEELMDRHAYEKGAVVLSMLRAELGDDAFFRSLAHYLRKHSFGVAETSDMRIAIEEATGRNMSWFFDQWLDSAGFPELDVEYDWRRDDKTIRLSVKQIQVREDGTPLFRLPVEVEIVTPDKSAAGSGEVRQSYRVVIEKAEQEFYFPCSRKPLMVAFDKGHRLLKLMRFPKAVQELIFQLKCDDDMLGRLRAARELAAFRTGEVIRELTTVLCGSDFWGVRLAAALSLGEMKTDEACGALTAHFSACEDASVRRGIATALGNYKTSEVVGLLDKALTSDQSYFVGVSAARALANIGSDEAYGILSRALSLTSWQEVIRASILNGFAQAKDKRAVDLAMTQTRYGEHQAVRVAAVSCLGALGKELHTDKADDRVVDHLIQLLNDKSIRVRTAAIRALGRVGNTRALGSLREATRNECLDQLKAALEDSISSLEKSEKK